jgi:glycosyltransferase involved in cell wall biosynthesis
LCGRPTGVGRYLSGLLRQWARSDRAAGHEFVLYAHEDLKSPGFGDGTVTPGAASNDPSSPLASRFSARIIPGTGGTWWEQAQLPAEIGRDRLDLFFAPGYTAPLRLPVPLAVAIHDVSFAARPEWFTMREGMRRRFLSRRAAGAAAAVITISEFSRRELIEHLAVEPARIHVIPPGIDGIISTAGGTVVADGGGPDGPAGAEEPNASVLYVGSIFNRRHIPDLLRAFAVLCRTHPGASLDLVGDNRTYPPQNIEAVIDREALNGRVRWRRYITDAELILLYRKARAFAFLSEYEGLGLTPLEALAAGIPAVLLDTPVARESCGPAALYARLGDVHGIARALGQLLFDRATRDQLLAAAPGVLARYDWVEAAQRTLAVLERAAAAAA